MSVALAAVDRSVGHTLRVVLDGNVTFREARDFQLALLAGYRLGPRTPMLCDARAMVGAPSASEVRILAHQMAPLVEAGLGPVAIVCGTPAIYGVARMFALHAESAQATVGAFRDMDEAIDWLARQAAA